MSDSVIAGSGTDISMIVSIAALVGTDDYAMINNANPLTPVNKLPDNDLGKFFDLLKGNIKNHLLDQSLISMLFLQLNSNYTENAALNDVLKVENFINTLIGRPVNVYINHWDEKTYSLTNKIVFQGYIVDAIENSEVNSGSTISLKCRTLLGQLSVLSSNGDYNTATKSYGNVFSSISANQVNLMQLLNTIKSGTLLNAYDIISNTSDTQDSTNIIINNGNAKPIPENIWAVILPDNKRLELLKELFIIYNRIIFQHENGNISIQPLFIDDMADQAYTVDYLSNYEIPGSDVTFEVNNWINISGNSNASQIPNRIDLIFGTTVPIPLYGLDSVPTTIFSSSPHISNNKIVSTNINGLDYTEIYKTSTRLYNSGYFVMPEMKTIQLDNSIALNSQLINSIFSLYNTQDISNSVIYNSNTPELNTIPQIYSQIYLAQNNIRNYNATVVYDYLAVINAPSPLGKIITINNFNRIDYPQMLAIGTELDFDAESGCTYTVDTAPLLSITGVWSKKSV